MADKYRRVDRPQPQLPMLPNEIRITSQGIRKNYISYAIDKLTNAGANSVLLRAMGGAMTSALTICEIIKHRIPSLHQHTAIASHTITDTYEPLEEGLKPVTLHRTVATVTILLTRDEQEAKAKGAEGYQPPIPDSEVVPERRELVERRGGYRGGRGGRGGGFGGYEGGVGNGAGGEYRGRGRGRGRGGYGGYGGGGGENGRAEGEESAGGDSEQSGGEGQWRGGRGRGRGGRGRGGGRGGYNGDAAASAESDGSSQPVGGEGRGGYRGRGGSRGRGGGRGGGRGRGRGPSNYDGNAMQTS